jgi:hypothetical protein
MGEVKVDEDGETILSADGLVELQIGVVGEPEATAVVDGAMVQVAIAPNTDLVTRIIDDGVQMIAVLGAQDASGEIAFTMALPEGSQLIPQSDGSIAVMAETTVEQVTPESAELLTSRIDAIIGSSLANGAITAAQWDAIESLPAPQVAPVTGTYQVAEIEAPWAWDANGEPVPTHFEIVESGLVQVVDVDRDTAFPVTADPSILVKALHPVNFAFAVALGLVVQKSVKAVGGSCRKESAYDLNVCWGGAGAITKLDGRGGGTTYGSTYYYAKKDPKIAYSAKAYKDLMTHEAAHYTQWIVVGPAFAVSYFQAESLSVKLAGKGGCGNVWEILAGLNKGGYKC